MDSKKVLLLDGGFSNELNNLCSFDVHQELLWTAKALQIDPDNVINTHYNYVKAGADIIETATFQATLPGFSKYLQLDHQAGEALMRDSVELAKKAISKYHQESPGSSRPVLVAGSIGPYGAYLADGSEYTGNYIDKLTTKDIRDLHYPRIKCLIEAGVDLLAIETFPCLKEAQIVFDILQEDFPETRAWICFSIKEQDPLNTAYGDSIVDSFNQMVEYKQLMGFGINCCSPSDISTFLETIVPTRNSSAKKDVKIIVYPNSGQEWSRGTGWINNPVPKIDTFTNEWLEKGADIIGGCCQIGPLTISRLRILIDEWNNNKNTEN